MDLRRSLVMTGWPLCSSTKSTWKTNGTHRSPTTGKEVPDPVQDGDQWPPFLALDGQAGRGQPPRRAQQAGPELLREPAQRLARLVEHVVLGAHVETLAGLEREHRPASGVVGVEGDGTWCGPAGAVTGPVWHRPGRVGGRPRDRVAGSNLECDVAAKFLPWVEP
jgi:hypothetical protein